MRGRRHWFAVACLGLIAWFALDSFTFGHEARPAYLQLKQTTPDTFDLLWKVPAQGDNLRLGLYVRLSVHQSWQKIAMRVIGSWVAAFGLLALAWYFRPNV